MRVSRVGRVSRVSRVKGSGLTLNLLKKNASERLGFGPAGAQDVKRHPFFTDKVLFL